MPKRHVHPIVFLILILPFGALGGYLQVAIGYLLAHAGEPQPTTRIVDALWGEDASPGSEATVQTYVSQLRKLFASDGPSLVYRAGGYVLELDAEHGRLSGALGFRAFTGPGHVGLLALGGGLALRAARDLDVLRPHARAPGLTPPRRPRRDVIFPAR